jgi:hypothetical protein
MNPLIEDRELGALLAAAAWVEPMERPDGSISTDEVRPEWIRAQYPPDEWTPALLKAAAQGNAWIETRNSNAAYVAGHIESLEQIKLGHSALQFDGWYDADTRLKMIGQTIADAMTSGDTATMKALWDLSKRWNGETREVNPKPLQLAVIQEAFTLWRTLKRNPTRNEVWAACEAAGISVGDTTNKRGLLQKTGLQFLAKE